MKQGLSICIITACLAGCAGVDITPISPQQARDAHAGRSGIKGYIVYEPMVVVEIKDLCSAKDAKGNCTTAETVCTAGAPFILPDYAKPYAVNVRSGFGKTGVEVAITNGWQLGSIKDQSDNTAVLGTIEKLFGALSLMPGSAKSSKCQAPGLYRVVPDDKGISFAPLLTY